MYKIHYTFHIISEIFQAFCFQDLCTCLELQKSEGWLKERVASPNFRADVPATFGKPKVFFFFTFFTFLWISGMSSRLINDGITEAIISKGNCNQLVDFYFYNL